ncbi:MAG: hypothetical protein MUC50_14310 [Myxococcota bacterium]|nr:hypothetical protein [Myxococcota bacterium]
MSFFARLFGGTFESNRDEADAHFASARWGEARLAYGKALDKAKDAPPQEVGRIRERVAACKLALAKVRLGDVDGYLSAGELDEALAVLDDALEICDAPPIKSTVEERRKAIAVAHQERLMGTAEEMSEDDVLAVIAGTWTEAQAQEMVEAPEDVRQALLLAHDGHHAEAAALLDAAVREVSREETPCYLCLELAKLQLAVDKLPAAVESLRVFLERCKDEAPDDRKLRATSHLILARILNKLDQKNDVREHWQAAMRLLPGSHEVLLSVGVMQRERGELDASLASLEKARELMGQLKPDVAVIREMGMTYLAKGARREAKETFMSVVEHFASKGEHEAIDPASALALAKLHEEDLEPAMAADLLRHLADGHDTDNRFFYNVEAARLLTLAGAEASLVSGYFDRATNLAKTDEARSLLTALRAQ